MKLTRAQRRALQAAISDGAIELTGGDKTSGVRCDVVGRLEDAGMLTWHPGRMDLGGTHSFYTITDAGRSALSASTAGSRSRQPNRLADPINTEGK